MSESNYNKAMAYIDNIILCLNDIASKVGHCSYEEFREKSI